VEETQARTGPPDKDADTPCAVVTGDLSHLMVMVSAAPGAKHTNAMKAVLDTCAGVNMIRRNQVPYGSKIRNYGHGTSVKAAQGQKVSTVGEVTLSMKVSESPDPFAADFVVVDALVFPALLGTQWIDRYCSAMDFICDPWEYYGRELHLL
jgi:hypothetical protein